MYQDDTAYMRLAIKEAKKGVGRTSPNPSVGAIIVREDTIVGRGYHRKAGTPHAEVNAIADAGEYASGATIYVTLEPCNHTGRTPPCTQAILDAGLSRVVVGMPDPNPSVEGGGSAYLRSKGIAVETGVLEDECRALNYPFIKHITTGLPWIVMKAGMSLDGRISYVTGQGGRITGDQSRRYTHELRNRLDAILVGVETARIDDPSLTTRLPETEDTRDPVRVIIDSKLRLDTQAALLSLQSDAPTWIYCGPDAPGERKIALEDAGASIYPVGCSSEGRLDLDEILKHLGSAGITSVLVEGGGRIHGYLLNHNLVDEVYLFTAPFFIGDQGTPMVAGYSSMAGETPLKLDNIECEMLGSDLLIHGFVHRK